MLSNIFFFNGTNLQEKKLSVEKTSLSKIQQSINHKLSNRRQAHMPIYSQEVMTDIFVLQKQQLQVNV